MRSAERLYLTVSRAFNFRCATLGGEALDDPPNLYPTYLAPRRFPMAAAAFFHLMHAQRALVGRSPGAFARGETKPTTGRGERGNACLHGGRLWRRASSCKDCQPRGPKDV